MFQKSSATGLQLKPSKCEFFKSQIAYLGHIVSKDGIETDSKKLTTIKEWPIPKTVTEVQSFLGFTNYYCKFIPKYLEVLKYSLEQYIGFVVRQTFIHYCGLYQV